MREVIVAGGGPAGLAAAIAARLEGMEVSVFDGLRPPIDKACGEGIMPDGLAALRRLGVTIPSEQACAFRGIRFLDESHSVEASFSNGTGYALPRVALHSLLVKHASALGVELNWGVRVTGIAGNSIEVGGKCIPFRWLVCADGQNSLLRRKSGLFPAASAKMRYGYRRHYKAVPWTDFVEVHWAECGQMYVTPIAEDEVCVAFITRDLSLRFDAALPLFSVLAARLRGAGTAGTTIGAVTASRRVRRVYNENVALLGEAAGSVDAITGEGLSIAFHQAMALANAMRRNRMHEYQQAHSRIMRAPRNMARLLLLLDGRERFRQRVLGALERQHEAFASMLAVHTGAQSVLDLGAGRALRLGWNLLRS
ncbi:MAG TPA: FAD-dependent monooxygenase [Candidatus Angelobacter sp.]|jgi:flavin-dependent dehydrogenase|nr:FAD-dependent monooxygenase [Candidatus Angelobacter sp.]